MAQYLNRLKLAIKNRALESSHLMPIFGIFGIINYPAFHIIWSLIARSDFQHIQTRIIAAILCTGLIFKDYWPRKLKAMLPIYWYITIIYCLPFFCTYMFLINHGSAASMLNVILATFMLIILVDWFSFAAVTLIGIIIAIIFYKITIGSIIVHPEELISMLINVTWVILVCIFFSYSKDAQAKERKLYTNQITALNHSLEQKVLKRTIELEEALAVKTEFLNNMSHEIRTPIQGFTAISAGLVEHWKLYDEEKRILFAKQVAKSAARLALLINNILDLSKLTTKKTIMNFVEFDLNNVIENIIDESKELYCYEKSVNIIFTHCKNAQLVADIDRIMQVLRNLFINAIKFSHNNSQIIASLTKANDNLYFTLTDEAIGIPEAELDKIFESFTQSTRTKTRAGGTGLGLSIAKNIIEAHHGKIWATNNKGAGSSFHFIIPVTQVI